MHVQQESVQEPEGTTDTLAPDIDPDSNQTPFQEILSGKSLHDDILNTAMSLVMTPAAPTPVVNEFKVYSRVVQLDLTFLATLCEKGGDNIPPLEPSNIFGVNSQVLSRQESIEWIYFWHRQVQLERLASSSMKAVADPRQNMSFQKSNNNASQILDSFLRKFNHQTCGGEL